MEKLNIKIYSIKKDITDTLEKMATELLANGFDLTIQHSDNVDEMMNKKINGIPALSINGEILFQETIPASKLDFENWVYSYLFKHSKSLVMKNILVPVDFSDTSKNAFRYALAYAKKTQANIKLIHAFNSPLDAANPAFLLSLGEQEGRLKSAMERMVADEMQQDSTIEVTYEIKLGFAVDEIVQQSNNGAIDLIIMGTMGEHIALEKIFGTVSSDVSQNAGCPVMLIPPKIEYLEIKDILFASDYTATEGQVLDKILKFAKTFNSALHFVHVNDHPNNLAISPEELIFEKVFSSKNTETALYFAEVKDLNVTDGLNKYIQNHKIDLLTVVTQKRSFWERLFHKSTTKRMVLNSEIPLLVLHI